MKTAIRTYRKKHGLSQSEFAEKLGISVRTLQNWEIGRNAPRGLAKIALLGVIKK
jgi:putative transcriptional regulator